MSELKSTPYSFDCIMQRMDTDPLFSFLYPICELSGEDTDEVIENVLKAARLTGEPPMMMATIYRSNMAVRIQRSRSEQ